MKIPLIYNLRSVGSARSPPRSPRSASGSWSRCSSAMLALANGFAAALTRTGSDRNVLRAPERRRHRDVERARPRRDQHPRRVAPRRARARRPAAGEPRGRTSSSRSAAWATPTQLANVVVRGVSEQAWEVRNNVRAARGHAARRRGRTRSASASGWSGGSPTPARRDDALRRPPMDRDLPLRGRRGRRFESEIWGENEQIMPAMRRDGFQSLAFRLADPASFDEAKRVLEADKRVTVDVAPRVGVLRQAVGAARHGSSGSSRS